MRPLPYSVTSAQVPFYVLLGVFILLEWRVRLRSFLNRQGSPADRRSRVVIYVAVAGSFGAGFALAAGFHAAELDVWRWPLFIAGLVLMGAGIAIRQWAVARLGFFFTTDVRLHPGQTVVENGPYRWVRHPSYTGMLLTLLGIGLALGNWAALVVLIVLPTIGLAYRIRVEEDAMLAGVGDAYRRFSATRARLIPGVW